MRGRLEDGGFLDVFAVTPLSSNGQPVRCHGPLGRWSSVLAAVLTFGILLAAVSPAQALSSADFPPQAPPSHVLDEAHVLSRASSQDIERTLQTFSAEKVDAKVITVAKLDYGLTLEQLGGDLLSRWVASPSTAGAEGESLLLLLIDAQTRSTAVVASAGLNGRLPSELLESTAETTMAIPLRSADRYRQATLDALNRLAVVLNGGEDPGEPVMQEAPAVVSNIPSKEETENSNAFTWVVVLLIVGTVVPMATWWVFSR